MKGIHPFALGRHNDFKFFLERLRKAARNVLITSINVLHYRPSISSKTIRGRREIGNCAESPFAPSAAVPSFFPPFSALLSRDRRTSSDKALTIVINNSRVSFSRRSTGWPRRSNGPPGPLALRAKWITAFCLIMGSPRPPPPLH